jgi:hypothetical protein
MITRKTRWGVDADTEGCPWGLGVLQTIRPLNLLCLCDPHLAQVPHDGHHKLGRRRYSAMTTPCKSRRSVEITALSCYTRVPHLHEFTTRHQTMD